ncbi:unnamed protein product [Linum tenue]|uniref:Uncharacterized protein n=1 Tax=Linum tenue TaxID=586396 RepID=A0AAV0LJY1_9ROSI|nr:unnamed protein product [Linum tenue]
MENADENAGDDYTQDGTVSLAGRPVLRSATGGWRACSFIVGYEVFERMAYYGIATNLVVYLSKELQEGTVQSANNVTNWAGTVWILPILGAYVADAHLGRFWTFAIASAVYFSGMILLTLAVSVPGLKPPTCPNGAAECDKEVTPLQKGIFYCALYIVAVGTGGTKPNISTMGADQFDEFESKEKVAKLEFFYDQAPQGMKSLGTSYFTSSIGLGQFLSSFLVRTVSEVTERRNGKGRGWILNNLNVSHLDYYYGLLVVLALVNFVVYLLVAKLFVYNVEGLDPKRQVMVQHHDGGDDDDGIVGIPKQ